MGTRHTVHRYVGCCIVGIVATTTAACGGRETDNITVVCPPSVDTTTPPSGDAGGGGTDGGTDSGADSGTTDGATGDASTPPTPVPLSGLFATGVDANGAPLGAGAIDPHYVLVSDDPNASGPNAYVPNAGVPLAEAWVDNTSASNWISVGPSTVGDNESSTYTTTFTLSGVDPTTASVSGTWACDDGCTMSLNGTEIASYPAPAWTAAQPFSIPAGSPFQLGVNTLVVSVANTPGGPTGLQILTIAGKADCAAGYATTAGKCVDVAGTLSGLRWELPCADPHSTAETCATNAAPVTTSTIASGATGTTYDVTLRFRGVVEERTYTGGTGSGYFYVGGDPPDRSDTWNIYSLTVSSPAQTYYLNSGTSDMQYCVGLDYTETIPIAAGATVTLNADAIDAGQIVNIDTSGNPIVVAGVPPAPSPFDGQFVQMDVVSVTPQ